jgi:hypothetical protein
MACALPFLPVKVIAAHESRNGRDRDAVMREAAVPPAKAAVPGSSPFE